MKCFDSWGNRGSPPSGIYGRWQRRGRLYPMGAPATRKCKDFLVAKKLPENDFQKSSKAAELQEAHREMRGIRFIVPVRTDSPSMHNNGKLANTVKVAIK
jgi:hypothetical protein